MSLTEPDVTVPRTVTSMFEGNPTPVELDPAWLAV